MSASTLNKIDKRLEKLDPESLRARVLTALRQFRASWVDLGRLLTDVAYGGDYREWGYEDFELYCARELGLKKPTVQKLMVSYNYMKTYAKERLDAYDESCEEDGGAVPNIPDYQTVELLHRARETGGLDEPSARRFHEMAFDEQAEEGDLRRELRESLRAADGDEPRGDGSGRKKELADILRTSRALRRKLAQTTAVPKGLRDRIEETLLELEALD